MLQTETNGMVSADLERQVTELKRTDLEKDRRIAVLERQVTIFQTKVGEAKSIEEVHALMTLMTQQQDPHHELNQPHEPPTPPCHSMIYYARCPTMS
jgi:hypothetical protein